MTLSAKTTPPSFLRNGSLFPTENQIQEKLSSIQTHLPKDPSFIVTSVPVYSSDEVSPKLLQLMYENFNVEIANGDTYPQYDSFNTVDDFKNYWFHSFCCILLKKPENCSDIMEFVKREDFDNWEDYYLGSFYIKPNYAGRCSQVCNAGFFIPEKFRGFKISYRLGQIYLKYAPKLGYSQSIYNLVYATNIGSWKTWEKLRFQRIGVVPNVAIPGKKQMAVTSENYEQYEYEYTDAYIYSKNLLTVEEELFADM